MLFRMRIYAIKADVVDKLLGAGVYDGWQALRDTFIDEETRAYENQERYTQFWAKSLRERLDADLTFTEKAADDYARFLERVSQSGTGIPMEGEKILDVLVVAVSLLMADNDLLDRMFTLRITALLTALAGASMEVEAAALQERLKKLQTGLKKARLEVKEAWAQLAIDTALTVVTECLSGPVVFLVAGVGFVGQLIVDDALGPDKSTAVSAAGNAANTLDAALDAQQEYLEATSKSLKIAADKAAEEFAPGAAQLATDAGKAAKTAKAAKVGGYFLAVTGFLFDANELRIAYANVDDLVRRMEKAKKEHEKLVAQIKLNKATVSGLIVALKTLRKEMEARADGSAGEIRQILEEEMRVTGYRPAI